MNTMASIDGAVDPTMSPTGDKRLDEMNARYFVVREGGKAFVGTFENEGGRQTLILMRFADFKSLHMNKRVV